jgi:hypothetical protein
MTKLYSIKGLQVLAICLSLLINSSIQAQVPSYVPTDGLVGYWPFNGNANDESGNGNDGTVNGATLTEDRNSNVNAAYNFDGISNYIDVGNPFLIQNTTESYTQSGWAYYIDYSTDDNGYTFISKRHDNSGNDWATPITRSNGSVIFFADDAFYTSPNLAQTSPLSLNQWHYLTFVKSNSNYSIYVDGSLVSSAVDSHVMGGSNNNLIIGAQLAWPEFMKGSLDDIGVWNRALTEEEILDLYNGCSVPSTAITGPLGPNALTETTYTCNGAANSTFEWTISNGVITSGQGTNTVTVLWAGTGLGSISVQETTNANCMGDLISINVVVIPTSIDELNESNLFLYPNPANDEITLQTNQSSIGSLYIIVDQTGKQIASGKITGTNTTIKLDQFASGMYTIIRDGKTSQQFQVIK